MLKIFVRIAKVDMDGFTGRDHHPTKEMEGSFVRVTNMDEVPPSSPLTNEDVDEDYPGQRITGPDFDTRDREGYDERFQIFRGILVDVNGEDVEGGEIELIDHEIESLDGVPILFSEKLA